LAYKWGIKTAYYFNTQDGQAEVDADQMIKDDQQAVSNPPDDENCDSCTI
jgi:hypothetical protein